MSIWAKPLTDKGITGSPQIWPNFFTALELQKTNHPNKNTILKKSNKCDNTMLTVIIIVLSTDSFL